MYKAVASDTFHCFMAFCYEQIIFHIPLEWLAVGVLSEPASKSWKKAFSSLSLSLYLVLPKASALKNLCFQGFEVRRILEITNFMIEWGKNAGNIKHISEYFDKIISEICISKTSSDNTPTAKYFKQILNFGYIAFYLLTKCAMVGII